MKEAKIREILKEKGYTLERIVRFSKSDRIRWHSKSLQVQLNLGRKIEQITEDQFRQWVL